MALKIKKTSKSKSSPRTKGDSKMRRRAGRDSTGGRKAEVELHQASRLYAVLSRINHFIVRAKEPDELFRAVCRVAVEFGKFRMAWVGLTGEADTKVKPVAYAGKVDGYLDKMVITADDLPTGKGPTGSSIREGKIKTCYDIATAPQMLPWKDEALKRGFRSSAAVPFRRKGKSVGALSLYAAEPGFFTETEQELLQEIGDEISFAIDAMASEIERREAEEKIRTLARFPAENPYPVMRLNRNGVILYANDASVPILSFWKCAPGMQVPEAIKKTIQEVFENGVKRTSEMQIEAKTFMFTMKPLPEDGYINLYAIDITERKLAEEALRESEKKYRSLVDGADEGILVAQEGKLKFVNRRLVEFSGYSEPELLAKPFPEFIYPDDRQMVMDNYMKRMKGEPAPSKYEFRILTADGSAKWVEMTIAGIDWNSKPAVLSFLADITERKQAEQRLRASEEKYRSLVDGANEGILVAQDGMVKFVNHRAVEFSGHSERELLSRPFTEFIYPDDRTMVLGYYMSRMKGDPSPTNYEFRLQTAGGSAKWVAINTVGIEWSGRPAALSFLTDIAERKQAEQELKESEEKFSKIFKTSPDAVTITRLSDGTYLEVNRNFTDVTGFTPEEVLGRSSLPGGVALWARVEDRDRMVTGLRAHGEVIGMEAPLRMKNGVNRVALLSARILEIKGEKCILTIARDITERKQAEEALLESEEKYRSLVDGANEAILVAQDGMLKFVNHKAAELSGYSETELMAKPFPEFIYPADRAMVVDNYMKRMKGEPVLSRYEFRLLSADGSAKWVDINSVLIDWKGKPASLNFLTDITGRKRLENEKELLQTQLLQAQKMEAIGTLAGGVAHDFNNLLTAISGYTTMAMGKIDESDPVQRDLKHVSTAAAKAAGVTRQLLLFSRKQHMEPVPMDPNATISRLIKMLDRLIGEDIVIETGLGNDIWSILGDEGNVEQVLMNLSVNARDAMPEGGKIFITTENVIIDEEYCRTCRAGRPGRFVCLSVSDTGTGMDQLTQEHIFEPFFTTKPEGKGTGLGLSVVLGIVQQHKGWINVYSEPGHGTTIKVYFPASSAGPEQQSKEDASLASLRGKGERIMVVEDQAEVRELAVEILKTNGYSVVPVSSAKEAMEVFERENGRFDLVFSDVVLTDMTGILLVEELLKRWKFGVIITSGYTDEKAHWDFIKKNNYCFLHKPYTSHDLLKAVKEVIAEKKS